MGPESYGVNHFTSYLSVSLKQTLCTFNSFQIVETLHSKEFSYIHVFKLVRNMRTASMVSGWLRRHQSLPKSLLAGEEIQCDGIHELTASDWGPCWASDMNFTRHQKQNDYNTRTKLNFRLPSVQSNLGKQRTEFHAIKDFYSLSQVTRSWI